MLFFNQFIDLLDNYVSIASEEYSHFEKSRHKHFVYEDYEGSHKKAIKYWVKNLDKCVHAVTNDRLFEVGEEIVQRSTDEVKSFYEELTEEDDKVLFLQVLIKREKKLLNLDLERFNGYKSDSTIKPSPAKKTSIPKPSVQIDSRTVDDIDKQAALARLIREKEIISVKEFEILYNMSIKTQQERRKRFNNPLPCVQAKAGGKVTYRVDIVDKWFENETK